MSFRNDLPYIFISLGSFQLFDHGNVIEQTLPEEYDLQVGDRFEWECGQFYGVAEIIKRENNTYTIKKNS